MRMQGGQGRNAKLMNAGPIKEISVFFPLLKRIPYAIREMFSCAILIKKKKFSVQSTKNKGKGRQDGNLHDEEMVDFT